ncbi:MAG: hypothetical protein RBG13Loki_2256 [Promethearchaeota archaeon CR_4]|nr:MAG: hypothetical protein RBG13Loki_2256 [Candidatus Lokiarchaeota archaeon CR_4]
MNTEASPDPLQDYFRKIWINLESLRILLARDSPIPEELFYPLSGEFTRLLNLVLKQYPDLNDRGKDSARPLILYCRQLQGYLVFLLRFPDILQVPHHSEINQTLDFITRREELLEKIYIPLAWQEKQLFSGQFREILEGYLAKYAKNK